MFQLRSLPPPGGRGSLRETPVAVPEPSLKIFTVKPAVWPTAIVLWSAVLMTSTSGETAVSGSSPLLVEMEVLLELALYVAIHCRSRHCRYVTGRRGVRAVAGDRDRLGVHRRGVRRIRRVKQLKGDRPGGVVRAFEVRGVCQLNAVPSMTVRLGVVVMVGLAALTVTCSLAALLSLAGLLLPSPL